jgi:hypothetical protein
MEEKQNFDLKILGKEDHIDRRMILKLLLKKLSVKMWCEFNWVMIGFSGGFCEHSNEPSSSMKV